MSQCVNGWRIRVTSLSARSPAIAHYLCRSHFDDPLANDLRRTACPSRSLLISLRFRPEIESSRGIKKYSTHLIIPLFSARPFWLSSSASPRSPCQKSLKYNPLDTVCLVYSALCTMYIRLVLAERQLVTWHIIPFH